MNDTPHFPEKVERAATVIVEDLNMMRSEDLPRKGESNGLDDVGFTTRRIGLYKILSGDANGASPWFGQAARYFLASRETFWEYLTESTDQDFWRSDPIRVRDAFHAALLSGLEDRRREAIRAVQSLDDEYPQRFQQDRSRYDRIQAAAAVLEDDPEAERLIETFDTNLHGTPDDARVLYEGYAETLRGILDRDREATQRGLDKIATDHLDDVPEDPDSPLDAINVSASALTVLAHLKGVDVRLETEAIPDAVYEIATLHDPLQPDSVDGLLEAQLPEVLEETPLVDEE